MTFYKWSQTAAADATADSSINWQEGQAPSSVNDSARAMMAALAKHRDDIGGPLSGSSGNAYTLTTYQQFDSLAHLANQLISFRSNNTNSGASTLSVDGLGTKPLRLAPNVETPGGTILAGVPYEVVYNLGDDCFYFFNFFGNPYNIPIGGGMDYWGTTTPNSSFAFPTGQAISRTVYSALFAIVGTTYGAGDGTTTFNLPDKTGRVSAMREAAASRLTSSYFGGNSANLGAVGGSENTSLAAGNIPTINSQITANLSVSTNSTNYVASNGNDATAINPGGSGGGGATVSIASGFLVSKIQSTGTTSGGGLIVSTNTSSGSNGNPARTVPPTIICNYIIRII